VWLGEHTQDSEQGVDLLLSIQRLALENDDKITASGQALAPDDLPKLGLPSGGFRRMEIAWRYI
jgi:hypothetical protein